jgi:hypothetical protein
LHYLSIHDGGGVYLWPSDKTMSVEPQQKGHDSMLCDYSILFEIHVTRIGTARILGRARFYGPTDKRWADWYKKAVIECGAEKPKDKGSSCKTKSVGKWTVGKRLTTPALAASAIRKFLLPPPPSLACLIAKL